LPINDSEIFVNSFGFIEDNGIQKEGIYNDRKFNINTKEVSCFNKYVQDTFSKSIARHGGYLNLINDRHFSLNRMLRRYEPDSSGFIKTRQYPLISLMDNSNNFIWSYLVGDTS
jgi:hypothetical protein